MLSAGAFHATCTGRPVPVWVAGSVNGAEPPSPFDAVAVRARSDLAESYASIWSFAKRSAPRSSARCSKPFSSAFWRSGSSTQ